MTERSHMSNESTDKELVKRVQKGDKGAFDVLVLKYEQKIVNLVMRYVRDPEQALDITQEAFIKAYRALPRFRGDSAFYTWLYRIAIRNALKHTAGDTVEFTETPDDSDGPLEQCIGEEARQNVWVRAKRVLNDDVYTAMWLRYVEDMSVRDIASVLERSASWTKVNLLRGRRALEAEMNGKAGNAGSEAYG